MIKKVTNYRRTKYRAKYKGKIKDRVSISQRPEIVKRRIGDLETDAIVWANGAIIVDRVW